MPREDFPEFDRLYLSVTRISSPKQLTYLVYNTVMKIESNCIVCESKLTGKQKLYCSIKCKNKVHQSYPAQKKRGLVRKLNLVHTFGGRCNLCGYDKNLSALAFHHLHGKEFKLDACALSNRTEQRIMDEVAKCKLLCHNCHAETHNPDLDLAKLSIEPTALTSELPPRNILNS